jgi:hypothetical protein
VLWLVKNGVPLDVAEALPPDEREAWAIIFCEFEGASFDEETMAWRKPGERPPS